MLLLSSTRTFSRLCSTSLRPWSMSKPEACPLNKHGRRNARRDLIMMYKNLVSGGTTLGREGFSKGNGECWHFGGRIER